jgi:hypothetical protein
MQNSFLGAVLLAAITVVGSAEFTPFTARAADETAPALELPIPAEGSSLLPVRPPFAKGPMRELDKSRKTVVIETRDGPASFVITDRTKLFRGPEKLTFDKLAVGDLIAVRFTTDADGRKIVSHAKVYPNPETSGGATNQTDRTHTALPSP